MEASETDAEGPATPGVEEPLEGREGSAGADPVGPFWPVGVPGVLARVLGSAARGAPGNFEGVV